jgi:hypothetical protein
MTIIYLILIIVFILFIDLISNILFDKIDRFFLRRMKKRLNKRKNKEQDL